MSYLIILIVNINIIKM